MKMNIIYHINKGQKPNSLVDGKEIFDKIQYPFMMKTCKLGMEGNLFEHP